MKNLFGAISFLTLSFVSLSAQAGIHYDSHGNVGYDTLAECRSAINSGTAKFYRSITSHPPLIRDGEMTVQQGRLGSLDPQYANGTCDLGTGHRGERDGVAKALQGKYIPYSPDMMINVYRNSAGRIVRVSMQQCDNWFSGAFPTGMPVTTVAPAPVVQPPTPAPTPATPTPVTAAPTPSAPAPTTAVNAAKGSIPLWIPVTAAGIIGIAVTAGGGDDDGTSGTTGTQ